MQNDKNYKTKISLQINEFFVQENWKNAKNLLENELKLFPEDHFLLTQLGTVYYEMRDYKKALIFTKKAVELDDKCSLALNNYAVALYINENYNEAIKIWNNIIETDIKIIAFGDCSEGIKFAKSLKNDILFRLGDAYLAINEKNKAIKYYNLHLKNRKQGIFSNFTKKEVEKEIKELVKII